MKINFMGTSHGYAEKCQFTSATLIEVSDFYYLLDAGAPVEWSIWLGVNGIGCPEAM